MGGPRRNQVEQAIPCPRTCRKDPCCLSDRKTPFPVRSSKTRLRAETCSSSQHEKWVQRYKRCSTPARKPRLRAGRLLSGKLAGRKNLSRNRFHPSRFAVRQQPDPAL